MIVKTQYFVELYIDKQLQRHQQPFSCLEDAKEFIVTNKLFNGRIVQYVQRVEEITNVVWPEGVK